MARRYLHPLLLLGASASVLGALAMSCGNGDSPLPAMDPNGSLFVTPCEYIFPLGTGDAGPSSVTFVVQGNTQSGLGADSVPISVQIEACNQAELFVPVGSQGSSCFGSQGLLPPATAPEEAWGGVQLSAPDAGGCTFRSPQELSCTLSADGVASFEVVPTLPAVSTKGKAIPLCVRSPPGNASSPWVLSVPIGFGPFGDGGATADAQGEGDAPGDTSDATGESGDSQGDVGDAPGDAPGGGQ